MSAPVSSKPDRALADAQAREPAVPLSLVMLVFFTSGVPALIYQMVWQRILALHSGVGIYSVAMIVAAFMAGLGIGSFGGGLLSERLSRRRALQGFALVELGIGGFAALSVWLYYDVLYLQGAWLYSTSWRIALAHFLALLPPTALMGMSLPLLVRAMVTDAAAAPRQIGLLYGINGLGAATGAILTPWFFIRLWGIPGAIQLGVVLNIAAGVAALVLGAIFTRNVAEQHAAEARSDLKLAPVAEQLPLALWALLYATSGFCALGLEIVWFRLIDAAVKSTAFTFGTVLGIYLIGLSVGSVVGAVFTPRLQRPLQAFLLCQALLASYTVLLICGVAYAPASTPGLPWYLSYWSLTEPFNPDPSFSTANFGSYLGRLYLALPGIVLGVPTFLMGLSFTILQRAVQDEEQSSGRKVGLLQAANIAGSTAGSLVVGLIALDAGGTAGTLRLLTLLGALFALLGLRSAALRPVFVLLVVGLSLGLWALPDQDGLWRRLHGVVDPTHPTLFAEDASGVVGLRLDRSTRTWTMFVNGKSHSELPYRRPPGDGGHMLLGALPTLIHPQPRDIAVIGLGSGATAWAAGCRDSIERLRVFEICSPEVELIRAIAEREKYVELRQFLDDPRVDIRIVDGRNGIAGSDAQYDIIEADATRPSSAYSGHLYSLEFFQQCRARLKPGGIMCSWAPTRRTFATFCQVFPHVLAVRDDAIVIGSNEPLALDGEELFARLRSTHVSSYLGSINTELVASAIRETHPGCAATYAGSSINGDLQPRDEFGYPDSYGRAYAMLKQAIDTLQVDRGDQASQFVAEAQALLPDSPLGFWVAARVATQRGDTTQAGQLFDRALDAAPCYAQARFDRTALAIAVGDRATSERLIPGTAELMPCNHVSQFFLGQLRRDQGDRAAAIAAFERAQTFEPAQWESALELARLYLDDDPAEAVKWAETSSKVARQTVIEVEETLARALLAAQRPSDAVATLERLVQLCKQQNDTAALQRAQALLARARAG